MVRTRDRVSSVRFVEKNLGTINITIMFSVKRDTTTSIDVNNYNVNIGILIIESSSTLIK